MHSNFDVIYFVVYSFSVGKCMFLMDVHVNVVSEADCELPGERLPVEVYYIICVFTIPFSL